MRKYLILLTIILLSFLLTGCTPKIMDSENTMTRVLTDDTQRVVEVPIHPQRILSLTSTYDTVLLDLVGPERLVAVNALSKYEDYSLVAEKAKKVNVMGFILFSPLAVLMTIPFWLKWGSHARVSLKMIKALLSVFDNKLLDTVIIIFAPTVLIFGDSSSTTST